MTDVLDHIRKKWVVDASANQDRGEETYLLTKYGSLHNAFQAFKELHAMLHDGDETGIDMFFMVLQITVDSEEAK